MVEHDALVGDLLNHLDTLKLAENTIVLYLTDNGPMVCLFPDSGTTPFRGEKNTHWEGGWRTPALIRWPGKVKPGARFTGIVAGEDWMPTLLAAAGVDDIKTKLLKGHDAGETTYKVHLWLRSDRLPHGQGRQKSAPRVFLFQRRWRSAGHALRAVESALHDSGSDRDRRLAPAIHDMTRPDLL
ncbi:MAG: Arylsulfatase [Planctomycetota bacterium]|jgi:arylsulfatase